MKRSFYVLVGLGLAGFAGCQGRPPDEAQELDGTWEQVSMEQQGNVVKPQKEIKLIITGDKFVIKADDKIVAAGTAKRDPSKNPHTVDSTYTEGPDKGKTFKGIYQRDGDTMKFCRPGSPEDQRPTEFKTTADSGGFVSVYKRAKE